MLGGLGYKFQFITLAGFHALNYSMFTLAKDYAKRGGYGSGLADVRHGLYGTCAGTPQGAWAQVTLVYATLLYDTCVGTLGDVVAVVRVQEIVCPQGLGPGEIPPH